MQGYLKTNVAMEKWLATDHPNGLPPFFLPVMKADRRCLEFALGKIHLEFGGFDDHLVDGLGTLRNRLSDSHGRGKKYQHVHPLDMPV